MSDKYLDLAKQLHENDASVASAMGGTPPVPGANLPAIFINRFFVSVTDDRVRVSFGEVIGGLETHHLAITLTHADAGDLGSLLTRLLAEHLAKISAMKKQ